MQETETKGRFNPVSGLNDYVELRKQRLQLEIIDKVSVAIAELTYYALVGIVVCSIAVLVSVVAAILIMQLTGNWQLAVIILCGLLVVMGAALLLTAKRTIRNKVIRSAVKGFYEDQNHGKFNSNGRSEE